jgi:hypothetical protein
MPQSVEAVIIVLRTRASLVYRENQFMRHEAIYDSAKDQIRTRNSDNVPAAVGIPEPDVELARWIWSQGFIDYLSSDESLPRKPQHS